MIQFEGNSAVFQGPHFVRRNDLTAFDRLSIAFQAIKGPWGSVTELAEKFGISRTFVYMLKDQLIHAVIQLFGNPVGESLLQTKKIILRQIVTFILHLRLVVRGSLIPISYMLKTYNAPVFHSVGAVSEILNWVGGFVPATITHEDSSDVLQYVAIASDEIFSHRIPILISADPISHVILEMELVDSRVTQKWIEHWDEIQSHGFSIYLLVNDEGISMAKAQKTAFPDTDRQPDTFHGIAYQLGNWNIRLEKKAFNKIEVEEDRYLRLDSIKSDKVLMKKIIEYEKALDEMNTAISLYDQFVYLYHEIIISLQTFNSSGSLNPRDATESTIETALILMEELDNPGLTKSIKKIRRVLPDLLNYFDVAKEIMNKLQSMPIPQDVIQSLCLAWQYEKNMIKAKNTKRKKMYRNLENEELSLVSEIIGIDRYREIKQEVYHKLDHIIQSSAVVENINSILRMYLNTTKNHISQNYLNLIMFYLNHRRFVAGKRKDKTPMELFTGKSQREDWIDLLLENVDFSQFPFSFPHK